MLNKYDMILKMLITATLACATIFSWPAHLVCEEAGMLLRTGQIVNMVGEVDIKKAGKSYWTKASTGVLISQFDTIKTGPGTSVDVEFSKKDGQYFKIRLRDESQLSFTRLEQESRTTIEDTLLDLAIGDVLVRTDKLQRKSKFRVRTPTSMVGVRGTRFEVTYR